VQTRPSQHEAAAAPMPLYYGTQAIRWQVSRLGRKRPRRRLKLVSYQDAALSLPREPPPDALPSPCRVLARIAWMRRERNS